MNSPGSVTQLIHDLRSADPAVRDLAARLVWSRYFRELLDLASRNLNKRIRQREDEEDVLQSMYKSFCLRQQRGEFDMSNRDQLWSLLVTITLRKARNAANRHRRTKRDVRREQAAPGEGSDDSQWALEQMDVSEPTPDEAVALNEALEKRLAVLDDELRQIALWKLEGWRNQEIAQRKECTERTVERKLDRIRGKWGRCEDGGDA